MSHDEQREIVSKKDIVGGVVSIKLSCPVTFNIW